MGTHRASQKPADRERRVLAHTGVLSCLDGYMNIALEQTEEHVNGAVTNRYGDAFIRGNNGTITPTLRVPRLTRPRPVDQSCTSLQLSLCSI